MRFRLQGQITRYSAGSWVLSAALLAGAGGAAGQASPQNGTAAVDPQKIVRDASWNELHSHSSGHSFSYLQHKVDPKGAQVKRIFETKDGDVTRLLEKDGKPLPPEDGAGRDRSPEPPAQPP